MRLPDYRTLDYCLVKRDVQEERPPFLTPGFACQRIFGWPLPTATLATRLDNSNRSSHFRQFTPNHLPLGSSLHVL